MSNRYSTDFTVSQPPDDQTDEKIRPLAVQARQALLRRMDTTTDLDPPSFFKTLLRDYNYYQRTSFSPVLPAHSDRASRRQSISESRR